MKLAITLLARAPEPGRVKTRLARDVGDDHAAALHQALALDLLESLAASPPVVALAGSPDAVASFEIRLREVVPALRVEPQPEADLGERMRVALQRRLDEGAAAAAVIGSDCLDVGACVGAVEGLLSRAEVVLVPAADGGFVLLAARRPLPAGALHGVAWGTSSAFEETVSALRATGLAVGGEELGPWDDVDDHPGLLRLRERLADGLGGGAPRTRRLLGLP